ncbi:MAG: signal peptidase I [Microbacterium sp.]
MQTLRTIAMSVLWALAALGVVCGVVWGLTAAGVIKPLVVISGSMEPEIMTGDLLIATRVPVEELEVGDVVSLDSELTDNLVTHRIQAIAPSGDGAYVVTMKGDANEFADALDYTVTGDAWMPYMRAAAMGTAITRMTTPAVALPLLVGLAGLMGLVWLVPARERGGRSRVGTPSGVPPLAETRRAHRAALDEATS